MITVDDMENIVESKQTQELERLKTWIENLEERIFKLEGMIKEDVVYNLRDSTVNNSVTYDVPIVKE